MASAALIVVWALQAAAGSLTPAIALAGPVEESKALNAKGAALFKKGEYLEAALAFEKAYALDPRDFRVLRYAGRSWQEIGHWDRALTLLERYYSLETEPDLKASVLAYLDKLRKATPEERADALDKGAAKYPQARLEVEAARALESLGTAAALQRAIQLCEVARMGTAAPEEKAAIDKQLQRVREQAKAAQAREEAGAPPNKSEPPSPPTPAGRPGPSGLQWAAWGGGGAVALGGVALWLLGRSQTQSAAAEVKRLQDPKLAGTEDNKRDMNKAKNDYDSGSAKFFAGIGLTVVGAAAVTAGFFLGPKDSKVALLPTADGAILLVKF